MLKCLLTRRLVERLAEQEGLDLAAVHRVVTATITAVADDIRAAARAHEKADEAVGIAARSLAVRLDFAVSRIGKHGIPGHRVTP